MLEQKKAVFIVGKSGLGKSTFANLLTGASTPVGSGMASVTRHPVEIPFKLKGTDSMVVDFTGTGDVAVEGQKPHTDDQIFTMIVQKTVNYRVVAIVIFISQDDLLAHRLCQRFATMVATIKSRFRGFESSSFFAVSGPKMIGDHQEFLTEAMSMYLQGNFDVMGITASNWYRCKRKDFDGPIEFCRQRLLAKDPAFLVPKDYRDNCSKCGLVGDPLFNTGVCRWHTHADGRLATHSKVSSKYHQQRS
ncbi:hypothetical protein HDU96_004446 [Phlyctochytrium bullatum]|nr:hypothetical protein HDU96_004446 [Phlyctochytrium bullatum]